MMPAVAQSDTHLSNLISKKIKQFAKKEGRRPRLLISSMDPKELDEITMKFAKSLAEVGFDIDIGPINSTVEQTARMAIENDAHIICLIHIDHKNLKLLNKLERALKQRDCEEIRVVGLGDIPRADHHRLMSADIKQCLRSGHHFLETVNRLMDKLGKGKTDSLLSPS